MSLLLSSLPFFPGTSSADTPGPGFSALAPLRCQPKFRDSPLKWPKPPSPNPRPSSRPSPVGSLRHSHHKPDDREKDNSKPEPPQPAGNAPGPVPTALARSRAWALPSQPKGKDLVNKRYWGLLAGNFFKLLCKLNFTRSHFCSTGIH